MSRNIFELHRPVVEDSASQGPQLTMPRGFSTRWSPRLSAAWVGDIWSSLSTIPGCGQPSSACTTDIVSQCTGRRTAATCPAAELVLTERHRSLYARQTLAAVAHVPVRRGLANARAASGLRSGPVLLIYLAGPITWDAAIHLVVRRPAE